MAVGAGDEVARRVNDGSQAAEVELRGVDVERQAEPAGLGPGVEGFVVQGNLQVGPGLIAIEDQAGGDRGQAGRGGGFHDGIHRRGGFLEAQLEVLGGGSLVGVLVGRWQVGLVEVRMQVAAADVFRAPLDDPVLVKAFIQILAQAETVGVSGQFSSGALVHERGDDAARGVEPGGEEGAVEGRVERGAWSVERDGGL